jgi:cellobiose phosphorylase
MGMDAVMEHLVDREGKLIKLLTPAFDKTPKNPGYIKGYPPGVRENGGQYTHAAAWVIIASAIQGRGDQAFDLFDLINPIYATSSARGVDTYQAEPYVMCGDVYSQNPLRGRAGWSWYTGSSGWLYQAGVEHIMGLKVQPTGFYVDPCIPRSWDRVTMRYRRGARTFSIEILNPSGIERGVRSLEVNGEIVPSGLVPFEHPGHSDNVEVRVTMA